MKFALSGDRVPSARYGEAIGEGLDRLPLVMRLRLGHVRFVCGVDPLFAGLHSYETTEDGRSYRDQAHCCYEFHLRSPRSRRMTTIVLPTVDDAHPVTVVHELGHALDELTGFSHTAAPVTAYARTNRREAFAEALIAWTHYYGDQDAAMRDEATLALFEELTA